MERRAISALFLSAVLAALFLVPNLSEAQTNRLDPLAGVWLVRDQSREFRLQLQPDGSFFLLVRVSGQADQQETGTWTSQPGRLVITNRRGEIYQYQYRFMNPDLLEVVDPEGQGMRMARQAPVAAPRPPAGNLPPPAAPAAAGGPPDPLYLGPYQDASENAFTVLVPRGWIAKGGILRVNPFTAGGPTNTVAAKTDFAVMSDPQGEVMIRWAPSFTYVDRRHMATSAMGLFPEGSNYRGSQVLALQSAESYLLRVAFPRTHHHAAGLRVIASRPLPEMARAYQRRMQLLGSRFTYDAHMIHVTYEERGRMFEEKLFCVIEDTGQLGVGMWSNKETLLMRAPLGRLAAWEPVLYIIHDSLRLNPTWVAGEVRGQAQRGRAARDMQDYEQRTMREILEHRRKTYAEIRKAMYLMMSGQAQFRNPHTGEVEVAPSRMKNRWVNGAGEEAYSNNPDFDPNRERAGRSDFKLAPEVPPAAD